MPEFEFIKHPITEHQSGTGCDNISRRRLLMATAAGFGCMALSPGLLAQSLPSAPKRGGLLRAAFTGNSAEPLNVLRSTETPLVYVRARLVWDTLIEAEVGGKIRYRIMQSIESDSRGMRWHLKIRKGIQFSDGSPLSSRDVMYSLRTLATNPTVQASMLAPVDFSASKIEDDSSLTLVLKQPTGAFDLRLGVVFVFPEHNQQIGSGGWTLQQADAHFSSLKPRNDYWDDDQRPVLDEIRLYGVDDMSARVNGLKAGQFDYIGSVPLIHAFSERSNPAIKVIMAEKSEWGDLGFIMNTSKPPFNQPQVVEALRLSIDRQAMVKTLTFGMGEVANDLYGSGQPWFNDQLAVRPYDPEKARALLKSAGLDNLTQQIITSSYEWGMVESSTLLLRQAKPAGFNLSIRKLPVADYYADIARLVGAPLKSIKYGVGLLPVTLFAFYGSKAPYSFSGVASPELDKLLSNLQQAQGESIVGAVHEVQEYLYYHGGDAFFARIPPIALSVPGLQGVQSIGSFDYPQLRAAWFEG